MVKTLRLGTALTAVGLIGAISACATPGPRAITRASIFGDKVDKNNIGIVIEVTCAHTIRIKSRSSSVINGGSKTTGTIPKQDANIV